MVNPTVILIAGPTAVGKTAAAIRLAREQRTAIVSADSRQCFRELNIGVAKPTPAELEAIHHYFINSHSIREEVSAATFETLALQWTQDIFRAQQDKGLPPFAIMVGGTGLYIRAFCEGMDEVPAIDPAVRQQIQEQYAREGMDWLSVTVREQDPAFFAVGETLNPQRMMRALEVKLSTGRSILSFRTGIKRERPFRIIKIALNLPKEELYRRINARVDLMMEEGLLEEVKGLVPYKDKNALQTVGYRELFAHLEGIMSLDEAIEEIKKNTRHYAKRQLTWFRKDPAFQWVDAFEFLESPGRFLPV